jgi:hypothetical protein
VRDGRASDAELKEKLKRLQRECERQDVELLMHLLPPTRRVSDAICEAAPPGPESFLIHLEKRQPRFQGD